MQHHLSEFERDGAVLVVDETSLGFVKGATVSWVILVRQGRGGGAGAVGPVGMTE